MKLWDVPSERATLGCILFDNTALDVADLQADDYYETKHRNIHAALSRLIVSGSEANIITLKDDLAKAGTPVDDDYLNRLQDMPTAANVKFYAGKVKELSRKRRILNLCKSINFKLESPTIGSDELIEEVESTLTDIVDKGVSDIKSIGKDLKTVLDMIERRHQQFLDNGNIPVLDGIESGYRSLDYLSNGFADGNLIIIGSRPSIGKTAIALNMALFISGKDVKCGFFSCEMTYQQLVTRSISGISGIEHKMIHQGAIKESTDWTRLLDASQRISGFPLLIDDTANISLSLLKSRARKMRRIGARIIFIDYLTLIRHGDPRMPRYERVGEISKSLKLLARELSIPIIAMSQLGREAEGQVPSLANLRQSGEIEEDADVIILMHRERDSEAEAIPTTFDFAKNRHGETGPCELVFVPRLVRFFEREQERTATAAMSKQSRKQAEPQRDITEPKPADSPTKEEDLF